MGNVLNSLSICHFLYTACFYVYSVLHSLYFLLCHPHSILHVPFLNILVSILQLLNSFSIIHLPFSICITNSSYTASILHSLFPIPLLLSPCSIFHYLYSIFSYIFSMFHSPSCIRHAPVPFSCSTLHSPHSNFLYTLNNNLHSTITIFHSWFFTSLSVFHIQYSFPHTLFSILHFLSPSSIL